MAPEERLWDMLSTVCINSLRRESMNGAFALWHDVVDSVRKERGECFVDAMSVQLRAFKLRCTCLQRRVGYRQPLLCAFSGWQGQVEVGRQRDRALRAMRCAVERRVADDLAFSVVRTFVAWCREIRREKVCACSPASSLRSSQLRTPASPNMCTSRLSAATSRHSPLSPQRAYAAIRCEASAGSSKAGHMEPRQSRTACAIKGAPFSRRETSQQDPGAMSPVAPMARGLRRGVTSDKIGASGKGSPRMGCSVSGSLATSSAGSASTTASDTVSSSDSCMTQTSSVASRHQSVSAHPLARGPQRFFYDTASYTGCARFRGPDVVDRLSASSKIGGSPRVVQSLDRQETPSRKRLIPAPSGALTVGCSPTVDQVVSRSSFGPSSSTCGKIMWSAPSSGD